MKLTQHQRKAYALRRMSLAVDRQIVASFEDEKSKAGRWVSAWARFAGL
jgi:hypothetical protein